MIVPMFDAGVCGPVCDAGSLGACVHHGSRNNTLRSREWFVLLVCVSHGMVLMVAMHVMKPMSVCHVVDNLWLA
jgi:hypothetical protein